MRRAMTAIPGLYYQKGEDAEQQQWDEAAEFVKRRHFIVEGQTLKLFGRRGKTYKGQVNLLTATSLRPTTDPSAPTGAFELLIRVSRGRSHTCILAPDHSADDLFMCLGNAVPSHVTSEQLWRRHMHSRPVIASEENPREFRMGRTLGTGTFGKVKLAHHADGRVFALKCLNRNRVVLAGQSGRLAKEIRLLRMLSHPNVIRLYEVLHTPVEVLMVMEYVEGGDLLEVLNTRPRFAEADVRHIFCQICSGVSFCHSLGVAHRDLKPENILLGSRLDDGVVTVRVADFGLSTLMTTGEMLRTACGSPHYVAPEILTFDGATSYDGKLSDVWSLGVILHVMLRYQLPFEAESTQLLYRKIRQGLSPLPPSLSAAAQSLLYGMLEVAPEKRFTLVQVVQHEWPQLQSRSADASIVLSQTVDAVVDLNIGNSTSFGSGSSSSRDFLSASNIFKAGGEPATAAMTEAHRVRRAFTFDALPLASDEPNVDSLLFLPEDATTRREQRSVLRANANKAARSLSPRSSSPPARYGSDTESPRVAMAIMTIPEYGERITIKAVGNGMASTGESESSDADGNGIGSADERISATSDRDTGFVSS